MISKPIFYNRGVYMQTDWLISVENHMMLLDGLAPLLPGQMQIMHHDWSNIDVNI